MVRVTLIVSAALLTGCLKQYSVTMGDQAPEDAHYVVVMTKMNGQMRVYDCRSAPDGGEWNPTCVKADMKSER